MLSGLITKDGEMGERSAIARARRGDQDAMAWLYSRHCDRVYRIVKRIVGATDADDVTQDVFVKAFLALPNFREEAAFSTWVYRMAVNASLSLCAKRKRRSTLLAKTDEKELPHLFAEAKPKTDLHLEHALEAALRQLPEGYKSVVILHDLEGLGHEACAQILGCSVGTSKSQLHKARHKLRKIIETQLPEYAERFGQEARIG